MKKLIFITLTFLASTAFALDLNTARSQGLVGERLDGYIGAVSSSPNAEIVAFVKEINKKRRTHYQEISKRNGQPLSVVEQLAAKKTIGRLSAGNYHMNAQGGWVKK